MGPTNYECTGLTNDVRFKEPWFQYMGMVGRERQMKTRIE